MATTANTIKAYTLDGTTRDFQVTFEYLSRAFVKLSLLTDTGSRKELVNGTDYTFTSTTDVHLSDSLSLSGYSLIEIRRETSATERVITFQDGSILRANDLNKSEIQALHIAEEARDAALTAIQQNTDGDLDATGRKIVNVKDGTDEKDAVNKSQLDAAVVSGTGFATQAKSSADAAHVSEVNAAKSASDASASATKSASQVSLAAAEVAKAKTEVNNAKAQVALAHDEFVSARNQAQNAAQSATTATAQVALATTQAQTASQSAVAAAGSVADATKVITDGKADVQSLVNQSTTKANQAAASATQAATSATTAKTEADRAKAEADKVAGQNALTNAINSVGATPAFTVDFKSIPTVGGQPITEVSTSGGVMVNSNIHLTAGQDCNSDTVAGRVFSVDKAVTNAPPMSGTGCTVMDSYAVQGTTKYRTQMAFEHGTIHIRNQTDSAANTWNAWITFSADSLLVDGGDLGTQDLNTVKTTGSYGQDNAANATGALHYPVAEKGVLMVWPSIGAKVAQTYQSIASGQSYIRSFDGTNWSAWVHTNATSNATDVFATAQPLGTQNLNSFGTTPGLFTQNASANATSANGYPIQQAGSLEIIQTGVAAANGTKGVVQRYTTYDTGRVFIRTYRANFSDWSPWVELYTTGSGLNHPTVSGSHVMDLNALDLMTGFYNLGSGCSNTPRGAQASQNTIGDFLVVMRATADLTIQEYHYHTAGSVYRRVKTSATDWSNWRQFTMFDNNNNITFYNNKGIYGQNTTASNKHLISVNQVNSVDVGDSSVSLNLLSQDIPVWNDGTTQHLLKVAENQAFTVNDANSDPNTWNNGNFGFVRFISTTTNASPVGQGVGQIYRYQKDASSAIYLIMTNGNGKQFSRTWSGTAWGAWKSFVDSSGATFSGTVILDNTVFLSGRNSANNANITIAQVSQNDEVHLGSTGVNTKIYSKAKPVWNDGSADHSFIFANGDQAIGGTLSATNFRVTSDRRLKSNFEEITGALDKLKAVQGLIYNKEGRTTREVGVIAQDVQQVLPEAVSEGEDGTLSVEPTALIALCFEAVKELAEKLGV